VSRAAEATIKLASNTIVARIRKTSDRGGTKTGRRFACVGPPELEFRLRRFSSLGLSTPPTGLKGLEVMSGVSCPPEDIVGEVNVGEDTGVGPGSDVLCRSNFSV